MREAESELESYLDWVAKRTPAAAERIRQEITDWTMRLARRPGMGNPNRWPGYLTHGFPKRSKRVVYRAHDDRIVIVAFRDTRQDERTLNLTSRQQDFD